MRLRVRSGNTRAREMYKDGDAPRDHAHESVDNPPEAEQRDKPQAGDSA